MVVVLTHLLHLLGASWSSLVASLGTTNVAIFAALGTFLLSLALMAYRKGLVSVKAHLTQTLRDGVLLTLVVWLLLYGWNVAKTIYIDHQALVSRLTPPHTSFSPKAISLVADEKMWVPGHAIPLIVPAHSTIYVLGISPTALTWGLQPLMNDSDKPIEWPSPQMMGKMGRTKKIWREPTCQFTLEDFSRTPILSGSITLLVSFRKPIPTSAKSQTGGPVVMTRTYEVPFNTLAGYGKKSISK